MKIEEYLIDYFPFEKSEMTRAYPNGFNEGYIDIKNIIIMI